MKLNLGPRARRPISTDALGASHRSARHWSLRLLLAGALLTATGIIATSTTGLAASATVKVTPTSLSIIGPALHVTSMAQTVTVTNTGAVPVQLDGTGQPCGSNVPCIAGANAADFQIFYNYCPKGTTIPVGQACTFQVKFTASTTSPESATVYIGDDATGSPQTVPLTGQAYVYVRTSNTIFKEVTTVPLSIFNTIGIKSVIPVTHLVVMKHQPPFRYGKFAGAFSWTAEFCPYCAAARWGLIVALSRFGNFNKLYDMSSSASDYAPNSPTFTFFMTKYTSPFLVFTGYEVQGPTAQAHMKVPLRITKLVDKYDVSPQGYTGVFPFLDLGNTAILIGSPWSPIYLSRQSRDAVAAGLVNPSLRLTKAIVADANFISSAICAIDGERPATVCKSSGVVKADVAQHLPR